MKANIFRVTGYIAFALLVFGESAQPEPLDEYFAGHPILGSIHPHPTARSHGGGLPRPAGEPRRSQLKPSSCISRISNFHCCMCAFAAPTGGQATGRNQPDRLVDVAATRLL